MTAPARATPEREAELRRLHSPASIVHGSLCLQCGLMYPCDVIEILDVLAAERIHAQRVNDRAVLCEQYGTKAEQVLTHHYNAGNLVGMAYHDLVGSVASLRTSISLLRLRAIR